MRREYRSRQWSNLRGCCGYSVARTRQPRGLLCGLHERIKLLTCRTCQRRRPGGPQPAWPRTAVVAWCARARAALPFSVERSPLSVLGTPSSPSTGATACTIIQHRRHPRAELGPIGHPPWARGLLRARCRWPRTLPTGPSRPDCDNDADTPKGHERKERGTHEEVDYLQHEQP